MISIINKVRLSIRNDLEAPEEQRRFGSGWSSGVFALVLSLGGLLLLLSLKFPQAFSMAELKVVHDLPYFKAVMQGALLLGFVLACSNMVLRRNRILGLSAIFFVFLAITLAQIIDDNVHGITSKQALGLDWFAINLLLTGIIFVPLEKIFGRLNQPLFRTEWREDLFYFLFASVLVQSLTYLSLAPSMAILQHANHWANLTEVVRSQAIWLQVIEIMFLTDFVQYWFHRAFHQIPFLWGFHAVHHSAQYMDWLAGSRMHLFEIIGLRSMTIIPMYALGFNETSLHIYILLVYLNATYLHANVKFNVECLKPFIATPRFHHWHHGIEKEAIDVNFSIHFPWLDKLFGTYYMPAKQWPSGYGIGGHPVPNGYWKQFTYPFLSDK